ncbi:NPC intracellular cholesterol transporter 2 homolog a-like isoform X2 [Athalia rosae]|uniref:NPC intracellular cholesterol transporter 2 homolog a-like isoform X2 n=1 Tax=Athalia rosae TaxID=37344 RepID=UPI0020348D2C|nr:NPC intracellular cholesterol transporter 2 homolog a-like isoform X2 [Athalia rosae]
MLRETFVLIIAIYAIADATKVSECNGDGRAYSDPNLVTITGCTDPPCILRRKTSIGINQRFTPYRDVKTLTTTVFANILGLNVPFVGVNGSNACNLIFNMDGTKATCPLQKGKEYMYKNSFPVREIYPRIPVVVHWALTEGQENIACFEVPSKITS